MSGTIDHTGPADADHVTGTLSTTVDIGIGDRRLHFEPMTSPATLDSPPFRTPEIQDNYDILDLFAGPGGLDVAAHFLGLTAIGIEWDANACETRYTAGLPTIHADVRAARNNAELCRQLVTRTRVLTGGPPCQTFSVAGSGAGRRALDQVTAFLKELARRPESTEDIDERLSKLGDPRTALVLEPLRWILAAIKHGSPFEAIALEQVPAVLPVWRVYEEILRHALPEGIHYRTCSTVLRTEQYGVPQTRRRAVLVARLLPMGQEDHESDEKLLPETTHLEFVRPRGEADPEADAEAGDAYLFDVPDPTTDKRSKEPLSPWKSMKKALEEARHALPGNKHLIARPTPFVVVSNYGSGGDPANRGRRTSNLPAFTVTGKVSRNVVETEAGEDLKRFTIHEAGVLQTFPADFPWSGRDKSQQVGNAVPPRFGTHVLAAACDLEEKRLKAALEKLDGWHWEDVPAETSDTLREIGCGDRASCPRTPPHVGAKPAAKVTF
jgi:DNA (cytosine-5)-methyltransferase 1